MIRDYPIYKPFRFWCQKVLPLVYDDSLSYYELLNKVVDYLNNVIKDVTALGSAFEELSTMVTDYFENLDVQEEIDNKLDSMVEDGTLDAMIQPLVGDAVSEWLEDNVTPTGSAVLVDSTLTISGAAADAKVTGDEIGDLKSDLSNYADYIVGCTDLALQATYTKNYYLADDGTPTQLDGFSYTSLLPVDTGSWTLIYSSKIDTNVIRIHGYDSNDEWVSMLAKRSAGGTGANVRTLGFVVPDGVTQIRVSIYYTKKILAIRKGSDLSKQIESLKTKVTDVDKLFNIYTNKFDKSDTENIHVGYFRSSATGNLTANSAFTEIYVPVMPNTTYICNGTNHKTSFYDSSNNLIGATADSDGIRRLSFTTPTDCAFVSLNFRHATYSVANYMVVEGDTFPSRYIGYGESLLVGTLMTEEGNNIASVVDGVSSDYQEIYHVGANREYTSFTECIRALANNTNRKIIYVDAGVYDLYNEIGGDTFADTISTSTWADWNDIIPMNTTIIGIGNVTFNFDVTSSNQLANNILSPINVIGSINMENITVNAKNSRYAIHDDGSSRAECDGSVHVYKNVFANKTGTKGYMQAFGSGIGKGTVFEFDNTVINGRRGATFHNNTNKYNGIITFKNSVLIGRESRGLDLNSMTSGDNSNSIIVNCMGCHISQGVKLQLESGYSNGTNPYKLTLSKCGEVQIDTSAYDANTLNFTPVQYN